MKNIVTPENFRIKSWFVADFTDFKMGTYYFQLLIRECYNYWQFKYEVIVTNGIICDYIGC